MIRNREYRRSLTILIVVIAFYCKEEILMEQETVTTKMWVLAITALLLAASIFLVDAYAKKSGITTLRRSTSPYYAGIS